MSRRSRRLATAGAKDLLAARALGACAAAVIAVTAVDMPDELFGAAGALSVPAMLFAAVEALLAATAVALVRWQVGWAQAAAVAAWLLAVAALAPAMIVDPLVAGGALLWHLLLITRVLLTAGTESASAGGRGIGQHGPAVRHLAGVAAVLTIAVVGYELGDRTTAFLICALLNAAALLYAVPYVRARRRLGSRFVLLSWALAGVGLVLGAWPGAALAVLAIAQLVVVADVTAAQRTTASLAADVLQNPSRLLALSFVGLIAVGTLLLSFPIAAAGSRAIAPLDALFTATSAVCVTGLVVLDTPTAFSPFGHGVILILIQLGGLGIMALSAFAMLALGGNLGLRGSHALREVLEQPDERTALGLVRFIVLATFALEAVGASVLAARFMMRGEPFGRALWLGCFHAVSAFCNAGFALMSDSLVGFADDGIVLGTVAALIVVGGLGFALIATMVARWRHRTAVGAFDVQTRAVLVMSLVLSLGGWLVYSLLEWHRSLAGLGVGEKLLGGIFQSITLRTAGFNSVPFDDLAPATIFVMMLLMLIGASPGGTGGGIKTTTVAVLIASVFANVRRGAVKLFDREISGDVVQRSLAIAVNATLTIAVGLFLLLVFEPLPFRDLAFEITSAVGTVGLSLGVTAVLGPAGKLVIIVAMFVGRIGPLTVALVLGTGRPRRALVRHPRGRIMVG